MRRALLASLCSLVAACGAPAPEELENPAGYELPDDGKTDTVNPTGTDRLGKLTILPPTATGGLVPINPTAYLVDRAVKEELAERHEAPLGEIATPVAVALAGAVGGHE